MHQSQPDGTAPLPVTAEIGGEGGSFGERASRGSRDGRGHVPLATDTLSDRAGHVARLPDVAPDEGPKGRRQADN